MYLNTRLMPHGTWRCSPRASARGMRTAACWTCGSACKPCAGAVVSPSAWRTSSGPSTAWRSLSEGVEIGFWKAMEAQKCHKMPEIDAFWPISASH